MASKIILNPIYSPIIASSSRYFVITGGRGSGKSFGVNSLLVSILLEPNQKILFLRKTLTSAYLSIIPEFIEKIEIMGLLNIFNITKSEITCTATGSSIFFRGIQTGSKDNTANLKSINGVTAMVVDEAEELTEEEVFDRIDLSIRQKGVQNRVMLIMNPTTYNHWIYQRFFEGNQVNAGSNITKNNVTYIHTTFEDNKENLDESFLEQVERIRLTNPDKYKHQILGGWIEQAEGVIFTNWIEGLFDTNLPYCYGADFGFSIDPDTLVKVAVNYRDKKVYIHECYYDRKQLSTDELAEMYKSRIERTQDLIVADSAEPRLIADIFKKRINIIECEKGPGSVVAGIIDLLGYTIIVSPESHNVKKELRNYAWNDKKAGIPVDDHNHSIDPLRYAFKHLTKHLGRNSQSSLLQNFR